MHESPDELVALQELLDASYAAAGEHLKSIHTPERRLTAEQVSENLKGVCVLNLATINASGAPMVAPVDGLFLGGKFWFGSAKNSIRFAHIRRDSRISAAYTLGEEVSVIVHGRAIEIDTSTGQYERFHDYCREIYGPGYDDWGFWGNAPFAWIDADRIYAMKMPKDL